MIKSTSHSTIPITLYLHFLKKNININCLQNKNCKNSIQKKYVLFYFHPTQKKNQILQIKLNYQTFSLLINIGDIFFC